VTASPACELQDASTHMRHCALSCSSVAEYGTASCKRVQDHIGIGTYDDDAPRNSHFEGLKNGCQSDEVANRFQNVNGAVRAPSCGDFQSCPTDIPTGAKASPACELQDAFTHTRHCALSCSNVAECGTASCKSGKGGVGICTCDDAVAEGALHPVMDSPGEEVGCDASLPGGPRAQIRLRMLLQIRFEAV